MARYPRIYINLDRVKHNTRVISGRCAELGISVVAVTKSILGNLRVAEAIAKSGIGMFADSRLPNLEKLGKKFKRNQLMQLRTPMLSEVGRMVRTCGISMETEIEAVKRIEKVCQRINKSHRIIIMLDIDDEREGLLPRQVLPFCRKVTKTCKWVEIYGLGTNARCISESEPKKSSLYALINAANVLKRELGIKVKVLSGGNSSLWNLIVAKKMPAGINQVRIGEAIFLGHETVGYRHIEGASQDCFVLEAEVIESKEGTKKAILGLGLQDTGAGKIRPKNKGIKVLGQSSDHTIISWDKESGETFLVGDKISFNIDYFGLLSCMTSPFVEKVYIED
ncbi:MAG: alanine racemase [Candidatus Humimicrobiaceae bacterium]